MKVGDVYVTNDPYHGGSHLPDITVVSPVFVSKASSNAFSNQFCFGLPLFLSKCIIGGICTIFEDNLP